MKKFWILFLLIPILFLDAYPIYEEVFASQQNEEQSSKSHSEAEDPHTNEAFSKEEESKHEYLEYWTFQELVPQESEDRSIQRHQSSIMDQEQPAISKHELVKRTPRFQGKTSQSKFRGYRRNPNRPRVTHRDGKVPKNLPKIEADAEDIEEGLSTQEIKPFEKGASIYKKYGLFEIDPKSINKQNESHSKPENQRGSHPGKRSGE